MSDVRLRELARRVSRHDQPSVDAFAREAVRMGLVEPGREHALTTPILYGGATPMQALELARAEERGLRAGYGLQTRGYGNSWHLVLTDRYGKTLRQQSGLTYEQAHLDGVFVRLVYQRLARMELRAAQRRTGNMRPNPGDETMRRLERASRAGDPGAGERLVAERRRRGMLPSGPRAPILQAFRAFHGKTGGIVGEAARTALDLARAEYEGRRRGWSIYIDPDEYDREFNLPTWSWSVVDRKGRPLWTLGMVHEDCRRSEYGRQLAAELMHEALTSRRPGSHRGIAGRPNPPACSCGGEIRLASDGSGYTCAACRRWFPPTQWDTGATLAPADPRRLGPTELERNTCHFCTRRVVAPETVCFKCRMKKGKAATAQRKAREKEQRRLEREAKAEALRLAREEAEEIRRRERQGGDQGTLFNPVVARNGPFPVTQGMVQFAREVAQRIRRRFQRRGARLPAGRMGFLSALVNAGPRYGKRDVRVHLAPEGIPGVSADAVQDGALGIITVYMKLDPSRRPRPVGGWERLEGVLLHELIHVFDPKLADPDLARATHREHEEAIRRYEQAVATQAPITKQIALAKHERKAYYRAPSEIDAYMTQRIHDFVEATLGGEPRESLETMRALIVRDLPMLAKRFANERYPEFTPEYAWQGDPKLWRKFLTKLRAALLAYRNTPLDDPNLELAPPRFYKNPRGLVAQELAEHPWLTKAQARRIVADHRRVGKNPGGDESALALERAALEGDVQAYHRLWREAVRRQSPELAARVQKIAGVLWDRYEKESEDAFRAARPLFDARFHASALTRDPLVAREVRSKRKKWDAARRRAFAIDRQIEAQKAQLRPSWSQAEDVVVYGLWGGERAFSKPRTEAWRRGWEAGRLAVEGGLRGPGIAGEPWKPQALGSLVAAQDALKHDLDSHAPAPAYRQNFVNGWCNGAALRGHALESVAKLFATLYGYPLNVHANPVEANP